MRNKFDDLMSYLSTVIQSFIDDPADSLYQEGYEAAVKDTYNYGKRVEDEE